MDFALQFEIATLRPLKFIENPSRHIGNTCRDIYHLPQTYREHKTLGYQDRLLAHLFYSGVAAQIWYTMSRIHPHLHHATGYIFTPPTHSALCCGQHLSLIKESSFGTRALICTRAVECATGNINTSHRHSSMHILCFAMVGLAAAHLNVRDICLFFLV